MIAKEARVKRFFNSMERILRSSKILIREVLTPETRVASQEIILIS